METALDLLKQDHDKVRKLLGELTDTTTRATKTRKQLVDTIETELLVHTTIEEEIFYPALRAAAKTNEHREVVAEAFEEHRVVEVMVLPDLKKTDVNSVQFGGRAKVLRELVEHHADEEEEEMFPLAEELLGQDTLVELGKRMKARKEKLLQQHHAA